MRSYQNNLTAYLLQFFHKIGYICFVGIQRQVGLAGGNHLRLIVGTKVYNAYIGVFIQHVLFKTGFAHSGGIAAYAGINNVGTDNGQHSLNPAGKGGKTVAKSNHRLFGKIGLECGFVKLNHFCAGYGRKFISLFRPQRNGDYIGVFKHVCGYLVCIGSNLFCGLKHLAVVAYGSIVYNNVIA